MPGALRRAHLLVLDGHDARGLKAAHGGADGLRGDVAQLAVQFGARAPCGTVESE